jgi:hypothetical protein
LTALGNQAVKRCAGSFQPALRLTKIVARRLSPQGETVAQFHAHSRAKRRRSALPITDTELRLMAAAAITGLSNSPKLG